MNKILSFFFLIGLLTVAAAPSSWAIPMEKVTREQINSRYEIVFPNGDKATLYLNIDNSFSFLPAFTNQDYVHVCWGGWAFDEADQQLTIQDANKCRILNGTYRVTEDKTAIILHGKDKKLIFNKLMVGR